jgi:integrase/recombinase XerD
LSRWPSEGRTWSCTGWNWSNAATRRPTVSRRLSTVAGLFKYAVIDELVTANPTMAVTRRTVLHPLEFAAVLSPARRHSDTAHALVALLGMLGLRVSEACNAQIKDLRYAGGYELLRVVGKGTKPAEIPLPIPVLRAVKVTTEAAPTGRSCYQQRERL